jgi:hypothetical protein
MALLDELEQSSLPPLMLSALTAAERSLLLGRLVALQATIAADAGQAAARAALELQERELQAASRWFG